MIATFLKDARAHRFVEYSISFSGQVLYLKQFSEECVLPGPVSPNTPLWAAPVFRLPHLVSGVGRAKRGADVGLWPVAIAPAPATLIIFRKIWNTNTTAVGLI
jgi:hypothetical protein